MRFFVIPAEAGIQLFKIVKNFLDSGLNRSDDFLRDHHSLENIFIVYYIQETVVKVVGRDNALELRCFSLDPLAPYRATNFFGEDPLLFTMSHERILLCGKLDTLCVFV